MRDYWQIKATQVATRNYSTGVVWLIVRCGKGGLSDTRPRQEVFDIRAVDLYGRLDRHGFFAIYFVIPCYRILLAWDEYRR